MGKSINVAIAHRSFDRREAIETRSYVEGLRGLRQIAGKAQADVASALNIKQPSVSKIEKQADMYLSTLRSYVEAVGGNLELVVRLPARTVVRLQNLGEVGANAVYMRRMSGRAKSKPGGGKSAAKAD